WYICLRGFKCGGALNDNSQSESILYDQDGSISVPGTVSLNESGSRRLELIKRGVSEWGLLPLAMPASALTTSAQGTRCYSYTVSPRRAASGRRSHDVWLKRGIAYSLPI